MLKARFWFNVSKSNSHFFSTDVYAWHHAKFFTCVISFTFPRGSHLISAMTLWKGYQHYPSLNRGETYKFRELN